MKKIFSLILAFVFVIGICLSAPVTITANAADIDDLTFELSNDNTFYIVTACNKAVSGEVVIPGEYKGKPVKRIDIEAFSNCSALESVKIPDSVTSIEPFAFYNCSALKNITLPNGITVIESDVFYLCSSLETIKIPDSVTKIGELAFYNCFALIEITIPDSVTVIERVAFSGCSSLKSVSLPKNLTVIKNNTFAGCSSLESVKIPESVVKIEDWAFVSCDSLKKIVIPGNVMEIGEKAIGYNSFLEIIPEFIIVGENDSIAEAYAKENAIHFYCEATHEHEFEMETITKPTCKTTGEGIAICFCGESNKMVIPVTEHSYTSEITKPATCTQEGIKLYTCTCGDSYTEIIPVLKHSTDDLINVKEATCTEQGYTGDRGCVNCGKIVKKGTVITSLGHNFQKNETSTSMSCTRCNAKKCVQDVPKLSSTLSKYDMKTFDYAVIEERELAWISGDLEQSVFLGDTLDLWFNDSDAMHDAGFEFGEYVDNNPVFYGLEVTRYMAWMGTNVGIIFKVPSLSTYNALVKKRESTHNSGDWVVERKATKDQCGIKVRKCKDCGITIEMRAIQKIVTKLATPSVKVANTPNGIKISWEHIYNAEKYIVYRRTYNASTKQWGSWTTLKNNYLGTTYTDETGKTETTYQYTVRAVNRDVKSSYKASASVKYQPTLTTKTELTAQGIKLTWTADKSAESYVVYRRTYDAKTKKYSGWSSIKTINKTSYLDTTVTLGTIYSYTVKAVNGNVQCKSTATKNVTYDSKPSISIAMASNGIKVSWSTVANATGYTVYRSEYNPKTESWSKWVNRGTAKANKTAWTDTKVKSGVCYKYTVRARYNSAASSYYQFVDEIVYLAQPTVKIANASTGMKVSWNKISGATGYTIYRAEYVNGKWSGWKNMGTIKKNATVSWVDKSAKSGTTYRYTVRAVNNEYVEVYKSAYTASSELLYLAQPKVAVKAVSNGINVSWTQSTGATGYTVYRMEYNTKTKKWSGWKKMGTAKSSKTNWTDKSAKKGVQYKYTVKAVNGKVASTYKASGSVKR